MNNRSIYTLAPEEISRFLARVRRESDPERYEVRLDEHLREVLARADDFVPSTAGAILLDDPRAKMQSKEPARLAVIACFGEGYRLGARVLASEGAIGTIYQSGQPLKLDEVIGVPVILGESICGVLELRGRRGGDVRGAERSETSSGSEAAPVIDARRRYEARDLELLRTFAGYISSSVQNALDAMRARELARRDELTGLYNDRFLHRRLQQEIVRAADDNTSVSVLFLDLDDFKRVNDTYGHLAGSRTLREVGQLIVSVLPPGAIAARYGGDEFVVILPGAYIESALAVGETLRWAVADAPFLSDVADYGLGKEGLHLTTSIGVATYLEHVGPIGSAERRSNALLRLADAAMYQSKSEGKNRTSLALAED